MEPMACRSRRLDRSAWMRDPQFNRVFPRQWRSREQKRQSLADGNFGVVGKRWFAEAPMAESTRSMRKSIYDRASSRSGKIGF
jgi:hypothetical protein